jgi:antirestriction protein ArdC
VRHAATTARRKGTEKFFAATGAVVRHGGNTLRKGEHGAMVVFADRLTKKETDANGDDVEREIPFLKAYTVFNVAQIEGLRAHYYVQPETKVEKLQLIESAEKFFPATGAVIPRHQVRRRVLHGRSRLSPKHLPPFLCADLGITPELREDHASYLGALRSRSSARTSARSSRAAAHAQRAVISSTACHRARKQHCRRRATPRKARRRRLPPAWLGPKSYVGTLERSHS